MLKKLPYLLAGLFAFLQAGEITVYDAANAEQYKVTHYTHRWVKDSNLKPVAEEKDGVLQIRYSGDQGGARSAFQVPPLDQLPAEVAVSGFKVTLDSNGAEFDKLKFAASFQDGTDAQFSIALTPGMKTYPANLIQRRSKSPINWRKLKLITMDTRNPKLEIRLKKIELITKESDIETAVVPILNERRVCEVLPEPGTDLGPWSEVRGNNLISAAESPLKMRLSYSPTELTVKAAGAFATAPRAAILKHDDHVFTDEALELLFSPKLDNNKFMQFTINAAGTVFDLKYDFDPVAAGVTYNRAWSLEHRKELSYDGKFQHYQLTFPFAALGFSPDKERFINFQAGQHYDPDRGQKIISWSPTRYFPRVRDFGVLVFNTKTFGPGKLRIDGIKALTSPSDLNRMMFEFDFAAEELPPGDYQLKLFLATAQGTMIAKTEKFDPAAPQSSIAIDSARQSGLYTVYLALVNSRGDWKMTAANYSYSTPVRDRIGETLLCPTPKQERKTGGEFSFGNGVSVKTASDASERTKLTARLFQDELAGYVKTGSGPAIELSIKPDLKPAAEGYTLNVMPDRITVTGQDEPGLYYGTRTLMQMIKGPMLRDGNIRIPCAEITDYPDVRNRIFRICHPALYRGTRLREFRGVDYILDYIERFIAAQKYNIFQLELASMTQFKRQPGFNGPERVYTLDDWKKIADYCRDRFIELVPSIPAGSHETVWLLSYRPELKIPGWRDTGDIRNPVHNQIIFDCMDDLLDATGAKRFSPKFDEWYHKRDKDALLSSEEYYNAFWSFVMQCYRHLKARNVGMIIFSDNFDPLSNGAYHGIYKGLDQLPKDVIFLHWGGGTPLNGVAGYFTGKGFEIWSSGTSSFTYNLESRRLLKGSGAAPYNLGKPVGLYDDGGTCYSSSPIFRSADYSWNLHHENDLPSVMERLADGSMANWRGVAAERPNPHGGSQVTTLDLSPYFDRSFDEYIKANLPEFSPKLKTGKIDIANIPMQVTNQVVMLDKDKGVKITCQEKASSLTFLLGAWYNTRLTKTNAFLKSGSPWRQWLYGFSAGDFVVRYQDGTTAAIPMRLFESFNWLNVDSLYRSTSGSRYVLPVEAGDGRYLFLYQYEWINPHPERPIVGIDFKPCGDFDFKLLLFALSARDVR